MVKDVVGYQRDTFRRLECLLTINVPNFLIVNICIDVHGLDVIHTERQNIFIVDGIYNGIAMELVAESLFRCKNIRPGCGCGIKRKNRSAGEAKHIVLLEALHDGGMHIPKLAAVALIEDNNNLPGINLMVFVLFDESGQFLNGRDDDMRF